MIARPEIGEFLRQAEKLVEGLHDARRSSAAERKRPIIFVCQGLGGLLIEKAILMLRDHTQIYKDLIDNLAFHWEEVSRFDSLIARELAASTDKQFWALTLPFPVCQYFENLETIYQWKQRLLMWDQERTDHLCNGHTVNRWSVLKHNWNRSRRFLDVDHRTICSLSYCTGQITISFAVDLHAMIDKALTRGNSSSWSEDMSFVESLEWFPPLQTPASSSTPTGASNVSPTRVVHVAPAQSTRDGYVRSNPTPTRPNMTSREHSGHRVSGEVNENQANDNSSELQATMRRTISSKFTTDDYKIGWISALAFEAAAAEVMLDEKHPDLPLDSRDSILYKLGRIGSHNVVIACLPAGYMGTSAATVVASHMQSKFRSMKFGFMVGIGGGVPSAENDIRLGDVVVSKPFDRHGGVVQWDFGKAEESGSRATGHLAAPPNLLLSVVGRLEADHEQGVHKYTSHIERFNKDPNLKNFRRPENEPDKLFRATYSHAGGPDCSRCDLRYLWRYPQRSMQDPILKVHYGTIASGNQVIKSAQTRDNIVNALGGRILCFEMEAAGLMNTFQCLVIRGIGDYCDSHKHDKWQRYAAANAAAYTRELVLTIPVDESVG
ncbi:purine and uridine phosphorylase [Aureobasidium pullulans]|nr:purine and uridine phosphorylase [Aureobasidium pullulans]